MVYKLINLIQGFPGGTMIKNLHASAGDMRDVGSISGSGRTPGVGNDNLLQYSCLENCMDKGAWWATVHGHCRVGQDWAHTQTWYKSMTLIYHNYSGLEKEKKKGSNFFWAISYSLIKAYYLKCYIIFNKGKITSLVIWINVWLWFIHSKPSNSRKSLAVLFVAHILISISFPTFICLNVCMCT